MRDDDLVDGMPVECGGIGDDGHTLIGVTPEMARARIAEGMRHGRLLAALWELPGGDVAVALQDRHANAKLVAALRRCADALAQTCRAH